MNDLSNDLVPAPSVPLLAASAGFTAGLKHAVERLMNPAPDGHILPPPQLTPAIQREAKEQLAHAERRAQDAPDDLIAGWLTKLGDLVAGTEATATSRTSAAMLVLRGLARGAFTPDTLRDVLREHKFFPAAAEIYARLEPESRRIRRERDVLRRIVSRARAPDAPAGAPGGARTVADALKPASEAEREAVRRLADTAIAELKGPTAPTREAPPASLVEPLQLALQTSGNGLRLRPDLRAALTAAGYPVPAPGEAAVASTSAPTPKI